MLRVWHNCGIAGTLSWSALVHAAYKHVFSAADLWPLKAALALPYGGPTSIAPPVPREYDTHPSAVAKNATFVQEAASYLRQFAHPFAAQALYPGGIPASGTVSFSPFSDETFCILLRFMQHRVRFWSAQHSELTQPLNIINLHSSQCWIVDLVCAIVIHSAVGRTVDIHKIQPV